MGAVLSLVFFLSGTAALLFESLWLRRAGLMLGNSVWASSIVLAAFMAGLAIGNALALRRAGRGLRPLGLYALLELAVAVTGTVVVLAAPALTLALAPLFRGLGQATALINLVRLAVAFVLVLVPTAAMGLTLPVLTRALSRSDQDFGRVLGRLYGWNTVGAALGAVAGELWLIAPLGLRGTALFAAALNLMAAGLAWWLSRRPAAATESEAISWHSPLAPLGPLNPRSLRLLTSAFLAGATLLALEVIWFRFLQLSLFGTTLTFAFMLAIILLGVGGGGLAASLWLRRRPGGHRFLPLVAATAALATTVSYALFSPSYQGNVFFISQPDATLVLSLRLMLATSLASGVLFTLQGAALRYQLSSAGETAGYLTLANTLGATLGALGAGFVLLPVLGMERSLFVLVALHGVVAALCGTGSRWLWIGSGATVALCLVLFPFGAMQARHLPTSLARFQTEGARVVAQREGVNQTTTILQTEWGGAPVAHRLVTNGHSMSGTDLADRRYMKLFVNWAVAVNPRIRTALLINYGLGSTAKALTDARALSSIDIVDISREILELNTTVFPAGHSPLGDPRVAVHVEDGRFFLQTTGRSFDLITGEPPPPKGAGIVTLYSRQYFQLLRDRLTEGGVATYWLPVEELDEDDARAVVSAFCTAFADCSLWTGAGPHWMLVGTRGLRQRPTDEAFVAQWGDAVVGPELVRIAVELPEQLGTTFLADARQLAPWIAGVPPLDDDHPHRLSPGRPRPERQDFIERWMEVGEASRRFEQSTLVRALWPPSLRERTRELFATQRLVNAVTDLPRSWPGLEELRDLLSDSTLRALPLLVVGSSPARQEIAQRAWARGERSPSLDVQVAFGALALRDYPRAAEHFAAAASARPGGAEALTARIYQAFALLLAEKSEDARAVLAAIGSAPTATPGHRRGLRWLAAMLANP